MSSKLRILEKQAINENHTNYSSWIGWIILVASCYMFYKVLLYYLHISLAEKNFFYPIAFYSTSNGLYEHR